MVGLGARVFSRLDSCRIQGRLYLLVGNYKSLLRFFEAYKKNTIQHDAFVGLPFSVRQKKARSLCAYQIIIVFPLTQLTFAMLSMSFVYLS
jgi:hypothetical protein